MEHYRPKGPVKAWQAPGNLPFRFKDKSAPTDRGYYRLAYDPLNYLGVCKVCNTNFKKQYFPVLKRRRMNSDDPITLASERPLLINPIHDDENPEDLIYFLGPTPKPRAQEGRSFRQVCESDQVRAEAIYDSSLIMLEKGSS